MTLRAASLGCGVPVTDTSGSLKLLHALLFAAHSIFFLLRMTTRALRLVPWGLDDTTIVIAWVCQTDVYDCQQAYTVTDIKF